MEIKKLFYLYCLICAVPYNISKAQSPFGSRFDINGDGQVTIADVTKVVNAVLSPEETSNEGQGLSFEAKILQMLATGYSNTEMVNSGVMSDFGNTHMKTVFNIGGGKISLSPCITIIDDDTIDGQIPSSFGSTNVNSNGGYFSVLLPFTLSLADRYGVEVKAGLACEGHRVGLTPISSSSDAYDGLNENGTCVKKLHDKQGWEVLNHSMTAQLPVLTYGVDSLNTDLANQILTEGTYAARYSFSNTIVLDKCTGKWYEVNKDKTAWVERVPTKKYAQLYYRDYGTNNYHINRDFDFEYSWGEWFRRAKELGLPYINAIVYNGSTTSPFTIANSRRYADFGIRTHMSTANIPPLTAAVHRFNVIGSSTGNVIDTQHKAKMMKAVDNCLRQDSWLVFMSHANNAALYNGYKSAYTYSEQDENYPSEWVIPLKREEILTMDENNYWTNPPARLDINRWADWHPAPGTQLAAFYDVIEYAISKGVRIVLPSEGWKSHGNRVQLGVDMNGTSAANPYLVDDYTDEEQSFFTIGADGTIRCYSK